jgi:hypothetical protein
VITNPVILEFSSSSASPSPAKERGKRPQDSRIRCENDICAENKVAPYRLSPKPVFNSPRSKAQNSKLPDPSQKKNAFVKPPAKKRMKSPVPNSQTARTATSPSTKAPASVLEVKQVELVTDLIDMTDAFTPPPNRDLCRTPIHEDLLSLYSPPRDPTRFSAREFVHSHLEIVSGRHAAVFRPNEDLIFAFQERLCTIIEVEVLTLKGRRVHVFPTKLNDYAENGVVTAAPEVRTPPRRVVVDSPARSPLHDFNSGSSPRKSRVSHLPVATSPHRSSNFSPIRSSPQKAPPEQSSPFSIDDFPAAVSVLRGSPAASPKPKSLAAALVCAVEADDFD